MNINKGSIETFIIDVADTTLNMTELPVGTTYDVVNTDDEAIVTNQGATVLGLRAFCLIDASLSAFVRGDYDLFLKFSVPPEVPRLGPYRFRVV